LKLRCKKKWRQLVVTRSVFFVPASSGYDIVCGMVLLTAVLLN
jgi:hypothetical protein